MRYGTSNGWLEGKAAAITRKVGKGWITYLGAWFDDTGDTADSASRAFFKWATEASGVTAALGPVPEGVEVYPRSGDGRKAFILVNFAKTPQTVSLPSPMRSVLDDKDVTTVTLARYGVTVLQAK